MEVLRELVCMKKDKVYNKVKLGVILVALGIVLSLFMYWYSHPIFDSKEYIELISLPVFISLTFVGFSLILEEYEKSIKF